MRERNHKAFTLIELLVALSVFLVISVGIYKTLGAGVRMWTRYGSISDENRRLRVLYDMISSDTANALAVSLGDGVEGSWNSDGMSFYAVINVYENGQAHEELARVSYGIEQGTLWRSLVTAKDGFDAKDPAKAVLLKGIKDANLKYIYGDTGTAAGPGALMPKAVILSIDRFEKFLLVNSGQINREAA